MKLTKGPTNPDCFLSKTKKKKRIKMSRNLITGLKRSSLHLPTKSLPTYRMPLKSKVRRRQALNFPAI